ncbi:alpha-galactosidase [Cellulomonas aerilata]|uniref:alpha-galactosidase n=1 Tax=Cellulomonas aerilata TaxID=515326 RepID=A0A512DBE7_9CELL|nr:alpha-galactosidase [Cellulomonas aerilata]GEO33801.1 alpha-galactosidase [Cellulomonas aerilata]
MTHAAPSVLALRAGGVGLVLDASGPGLPSVLHWGPDLGPLDDAALDGLRAASVPPQIGNGPDVPVTVSLVPEGSTGFTGTPGLTGHRAGGAAWSTAFRLRSVAVHPLGAPEADLVATHDRSPAGSPDSPATSSRDDAAHGGTGGRVVAEATDDEAGLDLSLEVELLASGLLRTRATVTNRGPGDYDLDGLGLALPVPPAATEVLDLAGRWAKERVPQRRPLTVGTHLREGRRGRTGADAATVLVAGEEGFGFARGQVWGVHVAWSGNHRAYAERVYSGERLLGGGELLLPGEVSLEPGGSYASPWLYGSTAEGLDALAARFYDHLRARPAHPRTPRPVVLNVWEAVYFDHDATRLRDLATTAAEVGVERFVLDDGWFRGRRDDTAGLGDWFVDEEVWPDGLRPLADHVHALGMSFGLWFEPEMVNPDSDLARAHPDWLLQVPGRLPVPSRSQQVLDVANPDVHAYLLDRIVTVVRDNAVDYVKWDHNRDLVDAGAPPTGAARVHAQTLAVYRLLDAVRAACPGVEIESCSSGGARVDLEILERTDRVWASDCIDAHDRQHIQRWTAQLLPPELVGSHVGSGRAHTTGRSHDLSFRAGTALFGHFGIEWDLTRATPAERAELAGWVGAYRTHRALVHTGRTVRADLADGAVWLHGVVGPGADEALYAVVVLDRPVTWPPGRLVLPGLRPDRTYAVTPVLPGTVSTDPRVVPPWWPGPVVLPGSVLVGAGLQVPALDPDHAALLHVRATG